MMKWAVLLWPVLATFSPNRNVHVERIAIIHALLACYVAWGVITGVWSLPGTWAKTQTVSADGTSQWYGWILWAASLLFALLAWIDRDIRFDPYSDARFPTRHRQISYATAFFGIWLIAYGNGYFYVPLWISVVVAVAAISGGMKIHRKK